MPSFVKAGAMCTCMYGKVPLPLKNSQTNVMAGGAPALALQVFKEYLDILSQYAIRKEYIGCGPTAFSTRPVCFISDIRANSPLKGLKQCARCRKQHGPPYESLVKFCIRCIFSYGCSTQNVTRSKANLFILILLQYSKPKIFILILSIRKFDKKISLWLLPTVKIHEQIGICATSFVQQNIFSVVKIC